MSKNAETFFSAWGEVDSTKRDALIRTAVTDDCDYADPKSSASILGVEALSEYVGMFSANAPGWSASVLKSDNVNGMTRVTVAFGGKGPDGNDTVMHGQYFIEESGDKISRMIGFVGTGEAT